MFYFLLKIIPFLFFFFFYSLLQLYISKQCLLYQKWLSHHTMRNHVLASEICMYNQHTTYNTDSEDV